MSASLQLLQTTQQGKYDFLHHFSWNLVFLEVFWHLGYFFCIFRRSLIVVAIQNKVIRHVMLYDSQPLFSYRRQLIKACMIWWWIWWSFWGFILGIEFRFLWGFVYFCSFLGFFLGSVCGSFWGSFWGFFWRFVLGCDLGLFLEFVLKFDLGLFWGFLRS